MAINFDKDEKGKENANLNTEDFSVSKKKCKRNDSHDYISSSLTMMIVLMTIACFYMMTKL